MTRSGLGQQLRRAVRSRRALIAALVVVAVAVTVAVLAAGSSAPDVRTRSQFLTGTPEAGVPVRIDTTLYLPAHTPAPAVLLAHGLGGTKASVDGEARSLAQHGYVVLAYSARGFGDSGGLVHLDAPAYEVHDATLLVDYLAALPEVRRDAGGPQIAVAGTSYGGGLALLLAGTDHRIRAVGADIAWNDLTHALFPNAVGGDPGVFKKMWAGALFTLSGAAGVRTLPVPVPGSFGPCGRYAADLCAAYQRVARAGTPDAAALTLLRASSPATVLDRITAPTLLTQGEQDSLFPLSEADANARGIAAHGTPVRVVWRSGGHDGGGDGTAALRSFLDDVFAGRVHVGARQPFDIAEQGAAISAASGRAVEQTLRVAAYPGIAGADAPTASVAVSGPAQVVLAPVGGTPAAVTDVPGSGGLAGLLGAFGGGLGVSTLPGQTAAFTSGRLPSRLLIAGAPTVRLTVTSLTSTDATLFLGVHDLAPDGADVLPSGLVAPLRLTGLRPGEPRTVDVRLPAVVRSVPAGHRLVLTVATTDLAYALPSDQRLYRISLPSDQAVLTVPTADGRVIRSGHPAAWLAVGVGALLVLLAGVGGVLLHRRRALHFDPALAGVPVAVTGLVKSYGDVRAVDGVSFRVDRGQVVGLLGPNGAGKTTVLRMFVGLITPTAGTVHIFGEPVAPGSRVLARVGAFIEGPGFLPHLTGRENLRLYWAATGRPAADADFDTALEIAGLGSSVDRRVKTYSHGMRQRLGIAQSMLGLPELLVLDEPTNGLDPPQIAEMREVLQRYADTGRTVVVSSHLLAEVEQTCTHVVVMHRGRLVAAGTVAEIAGVGRMQLAVTDPSRAVEVLAAAGIAARTVPARRALEDVFLDLVGED